VFLMGTVCELSAVSQEKTIADAAIEAGFRELVKVDDLMSDYKPESEISTLSREGYDRPIKLSKETQVVLRLSRRFSEISGGAFDCSVGPLVDLWRSAVKQQKMPSDTEIEAARACVNFKSILLDDNTNEARLAQPHMRLDLGAIAKGYAEDLAAESMLQTGATGGRLNMGGQVLVFGDVPEELSMAALVDPRNSHKTLGTLSLHNESLSTTADYERGKEIAGQKISHIIDPRTGRPATGSLGAMVLCPRGADADALSTVLFLTGEKEASNIVHSVGGSMIFVGADGNIFIEDTLQKKLL
jgi:thiamine biosynthesis lipoprotein